MLRARFSAARMGQLDPGDKLARLHKRLRVSCVYASGTTFTMCNPLLSTLPFSSSHDVLEEAIKETCMVRIKAL